jgi:hypothetical protein
MWVLQTLLLPGSLYAVISAVVCKRDVKSHNCNFHTALLIDEQFEDFGGFLVVLHILG